MNSQRMLDISVLYVEDEQAAREEVAAILQRRVRTLFTARDGGEGLELFREHCPDLVLTDIRMPVMDGLAMARTIRRESPEALVIVTSAYSDTQSLLAAIDIGVDQYVLKPVDVEKLTKAVGKCAEVIAARRVERQLQASETRLRAIFENSVDAIGISKAGIQVLVNPAYLALFGYDPHEALAGRSIMDIIAPDERPAVLERIQRRLRGEVFPMNYITKGLRKNGEEFAMEVNSSTYELAGELYTLVIMRDISDRVRAQNMSRKYVRDLEQLLQISRESTIASDLNGLYRTFVAVARDVLALDFSSLMLLSEDGRGLTVADCVGFPEGMAGNFTLLEGQGLATLVMRNKKAETVPDFNVEARFEVPPLVKEKGIRSALAVPMQMKDEVIGVMIGHTLGAREFTAVDVTIYQHIANQAAVAIRNVVNAEALRKSEKYVRDITAAMGEGVYVLDAAGNVTFMNPEAERLLGWSEAELLNRNAHAVIHRLQADGNPLPFDECNMRKVIETGHRFYSADEVFVSKDGTVFPVSVLSTPLLDQGRIVASVTAFRDITARKLFEQERERLISELQAAVAEINTLHGIIPICASCKKIRDEEGAWHQMEAYISAHTDAVFSHGICKECTKKLYPEYYESLYDKNEQEK